MFAANSAHAALNPSVRIAYLGHFALVVLAVAAAMLAAGAGEWRFAVVALLAATSAALVRARLAATGALAACAAEEDAPAAYYGGDVTSAARTAAQQRWRTSEAQRGTPGFDPWENLAARRALEAAERARG
ncbi:MAG: hypothetical protein QM691_02570 [Opitutaceae bacterium]